MFKKFTLCGNPMNWHFLTILEMHSVTSFLNLKYLYGNNRKFVTSDLCLHFESGDQNQVKRGLG